MASHKTYPPEMKARVVRMVSEWRDAGDRSDGGINEVAGHLGVRHESVRNWLRCHEIDAGERPTLTTEKRARVKQRQRRNLKVRRAESPLPAGRVDPAELFASTIR